MPLDFSIPLSGRQFQMPDVFETLSKARAIKDEFEDRRVQRETQEMRLGELRRQNDDRVAANRALQKAGGNARAAFRILREEGRAHVADAWEEDFLKRESQQAEIITKHQTAVKNAIDHGAALLASIKEPESKSKIKLTPGALMVPNISEADDWKRASEAYRSVRPAIVESLMSVGRKDLADTVPEEYDKDTVRSLMERGMSYSEILKSRTEAINNAKAVLETADNQVDLDTKIVKLFGPPFIANAQSPEEISQAIEGMKERGLSQETYGLLRGAKTHAQLVEIVNRIAYGKAPAARPGGMRMVNVDGKQVPRDTVFHPTDEGGYWSLAGSAVPVETQPMPPRGSGSGGAAQPKDDPKLPQGVKSWIDAFIPDAKKMEADAYAAYTSAGPGPGRKDPTGFARADAQARIEKGYADFKRDHPRLSMKTINDYLDEAFGTAGSTLDERKAYNALLANRRVYHGLAADPSTSAGSQPSPTPSPSPRPTPTTTPPPQAPRPTAMPPAMAPVTSSPRSSEPKTPTSVQNFPGLPKSKMDELRKFPIDRQFMLEIDGKTQVWKRTEKGFSLVR